MDCSYYSENLINYCQQFPPGDVAIKGQGKEGHSYRSWWRHATTLRLTWKTIRFIHST